jgi:hypothetical protein
VHESIDSIRGDNAFVVFAGQKLWNPEDVYVGANINAGQPEPLTPAQAREMAASLLRAADIAEAARLAK